MVGVRWKQKEALNMESSLVKIHQNDVGFTFFRIEKKTPVFRQTLQLTEVCCVASTVAGTDGKKDQMARLSA